MSTKINEGSFGKVYRPPLPCNDRQEHYNDAFVGKVTAEEDVDAELAAAKLVRKLDPEGMWSVVAIDACVIDAEAAGESYPYQLIYPYGGVALEDLLVVDGVGQFRAEMLEERSEWSKLSVAGFDKLVRLLSDFLPDLATLNDLYQHKDLHLRNLVYDGEQVRMIDFATLTDNRDLKKRYMKLKEKQYAEFGVGEEYMAEVMEDLTRVVDDDVKQTDIATLFREVLMILQSPWGKEVLGRKYKYWLSFHRQANTYEKLVEAIRVLPKSS